MSAQLPPSFFHFEITCYPPGMSTTRHTQNRRAVLAAAWLGRPVTRLELAHSTGLSTTTIAGIVADLIADQILLELNDRILAPGSTGGRPATQLAFNPALGALVGIHLGHADVQIVITGPDGSIRAEHARTTDVDHQPADTLEYVASTALDLVADLGVRHRDLLGVGVAVSAPVLLSSHTLGSPPMLSNWGEIDIAAALSKRMGLPVQVGNDANLGALAEWRQGTGAGTDNLIYVMISEGVGAGLIIRGQLYEGTTGAAGELGHVTVAPGGQICRCGNRGCLETVAGARALITALAHSRGPCSLADLITLAQQGDQGARRLMTDAGHAVGAALGPACTMLDPTLIIVGGALAQAGEPLLTGLRDSLTRTLSPVSNQALKVKPTQLGTQTEVLGAIAIAGDTALPSLA
jgi:predicted NBD/HSP70 family sugar kinase